MKVCESCNREVTRLRKRRGTPWQCDDCFCAPELRTQPGHWPRFSQAHGQWVEDRVEMQALDKKHGAVDLTSHEMKNAGRRDVRPDAGAVDLGLAARRAQQIWQERR